MLEDGFSVLIFPEGRRSDAGEIDRFRPGIGMIASRLGVPVVPVRIDGLDKVLHHTWKMASPGRVRVAFGAPMRLVGDDYEALAQAGGRGGESALDRASGLRAQGSSLAQLSAWAMPRAAQPSDACQPLALECPAEPID